MQWGKTFWIFGFSNFWIKKPLMFFLQKRAKLYLGVAILISYVSWVGSCVTLGLNRYSMKLRSYSLKWKVFLSLLIPIVVFPELSNDKSFHKLNYGHGPKISKLFSVRFFFLLTYLDEGNIQINIQWLNLINRT